MIKSGSMLPFVQCELVFLVDGLEISCAKSLNYRLPRVNLWENPHKPLTHAHLETWFTSNVYSNLIDFGLRDLTTNIDIVRYISSAICF